mmetsp:Transcript_66875/g.193234  ORF Transcript_66875/g.193234 Transcript_66875/m.193234 type:complete len:204 (-) Transcript_66875:260-871(-)
MHAALYVGAVGALRDLDLRARLLHEETEVRLELIPLPGRHPREHARHQRQEAGALSVATALDEFLRLLDGAGETREPDAGALVGLAYVGRQACLVLQLSQGAVIDDLIHQMSRHRDGQGVHGCDVLHGLLDRLLRCEGSVSIPILCPYACGPRVQVQGDVALLLELVLQLGQVAHGHGVHVFHQNRAIELCKHIPGLVTHENA